MSWMFLSLWGKKMMHDKVLVWFIYDINIYLNLKDIIAWKCWNLWVIDNLQKLIFKKCIGHHITNKKLIKIWEW